MTQQDIITAIKKVVGSGDIILEKPGMESHGDYASNIAMQLFSRVEERESERVKGKGRDHSEVEQRVEIESANNPRDLAEAIVKELKKDKKLSTIVDKIEVAEPGFINFWLSKDYLFENIQEVLKKEDQYGSIDIGKDQIVLVEYSAPNIARRFSIGHLRSTIIGQALYNTLKFAGYKTIGENHLGDWGTQFGMIMASIAKNKLDYNKLSVADYQRLYVEFNKACQDDPSMRDDAKAWFKKLEDGDKEAREIWESAISNSYKEFDRIYEMLGVKIDNAHGESFYEDKMPDVISEFKEKGLVKKSEGAEIVELKGMVPAILIKSDGGTTYFTRDLAALKYRLDTWKPSVLIYEVGVEQKLHFKQVFESAKLVGWVKNQKLIHVPHGHYRFKGKKISTRKGAEIILEDIIDEAIKRARNILNKSQTVKDLSTDEKREIAEAVGIGAIKYFDLSHRPESQIDFDWEGMFAMQGNSGPYIQYTYARTQSVLSKSKRAGELKSKSVIASEAKQSQNEIAASFSTPRDDVSFNKEELSLLRSFIQFPGVIEDVANSYSPNLLCNYLFDLAQKFNSFYNSHRILDGKSKRAGEQEGKSHSGVESETTMFRIALSAATGQILANGLTLLGIDTPQKM